MFLQICHMQFEVDVVRTMEYSALEAAEHCTCAYCRNFYAAVDAHYPGLRAFLGQFGVDIEAPEEQLPYDCCGGMIYDSSYRVYGKVLSKGNGELLADDVVIRVIEDADGGEENNCFFTLEFDLSLPWVLDEPMSETLSPANDPDFLELMQDRLLARSKRKEQS